MRLGWRRAAKMAENQKGTGSGQSPGEERHLKPWLRRRLTGKTAWPNRPGPSIGEPGSRLLRRVVNRQPLVSRQPDAMAFSSPIHGNRSGYQAASAWSALELLVSNRDAGHDATRAPSASPFGRGTEGGTLAKNARIASPAEGSVARSARNVLPSVPPFVPGTGSGTVAKNAWTVSPTEASTTPSAASAVPRAPVTGAQPGRATIVRRKIEEAPASPPTPPIQNTRRAAEKSISPSPGAAADAPDAAPTEKLDDNNIPHGGPLISGEKRLPPLTDGEPETSRVVASSPAGHGDRSPVASETVRTRDVRAPRLSRHSAAVDCKSSPAPSHRSGPAKAARVDRASSGDSAAKQTNKSDSSDFVSSRLEAAPVVQQQGKSTPRVSSQSVVMPSGDVRSESGPVTAPQGGGAPSTGAAVVRKPLSSVDASPKGKTSSRTLRMKPAEAISGWEQQPAGGLNAPQGSEGGSSLQPLTDVGRAQRKVANVPGQASQESPGQSPPTLRSEASIDASPHQDVSHGTHTLPVESGISIASAAEKHGVTADLPVQRSVSTQAESAEVYVVEHATGDALISIPARRGQSRASLPVPAMPSRSLQRSTRADLSAGRSELLPDSGFETGSSGRSSYAPVSLTVGGSGRSTVFTQATSLTGAAPRSPGAGTPAMDLPVARVSRAKTVGETTNGGDIFRQPSGSPPPPPNMVHSLPGFGSSTTHVSRAPEDAASSSSPSPAASQPGDRAAPPDLKALARDIYPLIRRMLIIEKERLPHL